MFGMPENGTYLTSGSDITLIANGAAGLQAGAPRPYCVQGNTLLIEVQSADPDAGIPNTIVVSATKQ
jgi:hypothetical protein